MAKRAYHYFVDSEGKLWHEGYEFDDPDLLRFFMENMEVLPDGRWRVLCQGEECLITAEDVPYVVKRIEPRPAAIGLLFAGDYQEDLDPATLFVGGQNVLYCKVRKGKFTARFNRTSYMKLTEGVRFDRAKKSYVLEIGARRYPIRGVIEV